MRRLGVLKNAPTLARVPASKPERRHRLGGDRFGQYAVALTRSHRLIFAPAHHPAPQLEDGGLDTNRVTAITIIEVVDYH